MADKRISQLIERTDIANNDVLPIVASGATTTNKVTISTIQEWMQDNLDVGVTSVGITLGSSGTDVNVTGSPITTSGNITINIPTASATNRGLLSSSDWSSFNSKLSSVGLTMPSAFTVSNSPLTANGTIAVTGAGTVAQYIRGDGSLADFPEAGGGGASVSYYLNGSVSQGTIGGIAYREMNKTPILGAGTNFTIAADGYIASFITDAGDPNLLLIPGGNWNLETYFAASSGGGTPSFYVELYKVDSGGTATLIASNSANPELIAFGTTTTAYFSSLAVPPTVLTLTDRLALRYYVTHSGRTITMHTEDANLCQVITTFTTGLTALNGLTAQVQNFATGTSGTDFNISSSSATHTFNLPDASASNRGVVTTGTQTFAGYKIFTGTIGVNQDIQLATQGTALNTFIKNINATGLTSIGSNGFGFNNANNIYFSGSSKGGGVFAFSNTGTQTYTLQDASGTLAFTSDLGNYIQGVGTADSIPKFTAARTLANSAIRDTTSTVVISKNVSVDNGASQAINLTPASGGTTNRIETTGTLPLAIITSGSSITLAAGGVTPQITLASTGAVTLTGALNGTSASFTGQTSSSNYVASGGNNTTVFNSSGATTGWVQLAMNNNSGSALLGVEGATAGTLATGTNAYASVLRNYTATDFHIATNNVVRATISSTGAATFSSSLTAGGQVSINAGNGNQLYLNNSGQRYTQITFDNNTSGTSKAGIWYDNTSNVFDLFANTGGSIRMLTGGVFGSPALTLSSTGAATFSSSVTINGTGNPALDVQGTAIIRGNGSAYATHYFTTSAANVAQYDQYDASGNIKNRLRADGNSYITGGNVGIGTASPQSWTRLEVAGTAGAQTDAAQQVTIAAPTTTVGHGAGLRFNAASGAKEAVGIVGMVNEASGNLGAMTFHTYGGGANIPERMRITSGGDVLINKQTLSGGSVGVEFERNSSTRMTTDGNTVLLLNRLSSDGTIVDIRRSGTQVGTISVTTTATSYNTSSDYRLKENVKPIENALSVLTQLKPCTFNFIADADEEVMGFIAHEVQEVIPQAVTGEKDGFKIEEVEVSPAELDEEGNIITEALIEEKEVPVYQGIDHSKLVPLLVASIQELKAEIEALKSQING